MKYKPHLLMNPEKGTFKFIYIDSMIMTKTSKTFDSLDKVASTTYSPLKALVVGYQIPKIS